jgi:hypothetical protein
VRREDGRESDGAGFGLVDGAEMSLRLAVACKRLFDTQRPEVKNYRQIAIVRIFLIQIDGNGGLLRDGNGLQDRRET